MKNLMRIYLVLILAGTVVAAQPPARFLAALPRSAGRSLCAMLDFVNTLDQQIEACTA